MSYTWLYKIKYSDRNNYEKVYSARYNGESTYRYNFNIGTYPAFVVVDTEMMKLISQILMIDKQLYIMQSDLPIVALDNFKHKCLVDEVKQTNDLEGVASTRKEINDILYRRTRGSSRLKGIVNKYAMLLYDNDIALSSCSDIRKLYDELVLPEIKQSDSENIPDGNVFRQGQVYVKDKMTGDVIHTGIYPESKITEYMTSLLATINSKEYNPLINIAVIHYMFGYIHPFYDGNGRMSRFISSYLLSKNIEQIISYRLSYAIKKDTAKYYKMFKLTNDDDNRGDMTKFTLYFMELIRDTMAELYHKFYDYLEMLEEKQKKISETDYEDGCKDVLYILTQNTLFNNEGLSIGMLSGILRRSDATLRKCIKLLEENDDVIKIKARPYRYDANIKRIGQR